MQDATRPVCHRRRIVPSSFGLEPLEGRGLFSTSASMLMDIAPGAASSASPHQLDAPVLAGNRAVFAATDATGAQSLWATDGTAGGTGKLLPLSGAGASVHALAGSAGVAYAITSNGLLYWTDGTPAGTKVVGDGGLTLRQEPLEGGQIADSFVSMDGAVYFSAQSLQGGDGYELWRGTGVFASRVKDIRAGSTSSSPRNLTVIGHTIFFTVSTGTGVPQFELWKSDGSASGTVMVRSFDSGISASHNPDYLTNVNGTLFFRAAGPSGDELWKSDGTAAGTVLVKAIGGSLFGNNVDLNLTAAGGTVYFAANGSPTGQTGIELWKSDGTANGTVRVKDIEPGPGGSEPAVLRAAGDGRHVFFSALTGAEGRELWTSDGTDAGTYRVADLYARSQSSNPYPLLGAADGTTYFSAATPDAGRELWATDGTPAGTRLVRDINPGAGNALLTASPGDPMLALPPAAGTPVGAPARVLFWAYDGTHGAEPWTVGGPAAASTVVGRPVLQPQSVRRL